MPSNGPDRCRGNLNCRKFHDGALPAEMSSLYQCCCCDPCRYIRPNTGLNTDKPVPVNYCCRCVPRGMLLVFTPDDPNDACCLAYVEPMLYQRGDNYLATYSGTLFGVTVTVTLGRDEYDQCVWTVTAEEYGQADIEETYIVDHVDVTCLEVPTSLSIAADGPLGCSGTLELRDIPKAKLPFQETWPYDVPSPKFIDVDYPCGDCTQVCSMLCVTGVRHAGGASERVNFEWFDNGETRGWMYDPGGDEYLETIYLDEDEYGNCELVFDFEYGSEYFEPTTISGGCSCGLEETVCSTGDDPFCITIRCGVCSCWGFHCGTCRCVPSKLCVVVVEGSTATQYSLDWDGDSSWGDGALQIHLGPDENNDCEITVSLYGYDTSEMASAVTCSSESITNVFDPSSEVISFSFEDSAQELFIIGSSMLQDCSRGKCEEATPCNDDCGGHPDSLTITIRQWALPGDTSGDPVDCSVDVVVHFWQTADYVDNEGVIKYSCGYVGWLKLADPSCYIKVELRAGQVLISTPASAQVGGCTAAASSTVELTSESCNPYLASSDELLGVNLLDELLMGCGDQSYRAQVTVTE